MTVCDIPPTYNTDISTTLTSYAQQGCNAYLETISLRLVGSKILHVGTGTSSMFIKWHNICKEIHGLGVMDSELELATQLSMQFGIKYPTWKINKYDLDQLKQIDTDYTFICDTNPKMFACCDFHWHQYFYFIVNRLIPGGQFITHTNGFPAHTNFTTKLTTEELISLLPKGFRIFEIPSMINLCQCWPVIIEKVL